MCQDGNSASLSVRYLESQLDALYQNASECVNSVKDSSPNTEVEKYEKGKYTRALRQFHFFGKKAPQDAKTSSDYHFYALFGRPSLKFICNHDVILHLKLKSGHYNTDYTKPHTEELSANQ